ncbi:hypothetical protein JCM21714_2117 [Gracilibacillus boraciitolerans JCM 21714]|uniref:Uncharacterized protein n=1 Tax=Gracilibacillus boraciitolerans JCM 21714 TaxID=1298598 RepID=W4VI49_9BACI|nr:hypothetical protein [Gracilibacillus boraciitolerans]GAE93080.1 hypothetical protein JCM21714_2117 [Gracilibacillus boraciitolerans JCM 21714]
MISWIKYLVIGGVIFVSGIILITNAGGVRHSTNVTATQEVQIATKSAQIGGEMRENTDNKIDKKAIVNNMILDIAKTHKEQGKDIEVDYMFLDGSGNKTSNDDNIESVQFLVKIMDKGKIISRSEQRIDLKKY